MAYRQNNPFSRKTSNPIKQVGVPGLTRAVQSLREDPRIDPTYDPVGRQYGYGRQANIRLVDEDKQPYTGEGGVAGIMGGNYGIAPSEIYKPTGFQVDRYFTGDAYVFGDEGKELRKNLMFDPETGYSRKLLPITYDKDPRTGNPRSAEINGKTYNLRLTKDRQDFERERENMYYNQSKLLQEANAMYQLGKNPEKYLSNIPENADERSYNRPGGGFITKSGEEARKKFYEVYGDPESEERAKIYEALKTSSSVPMELSYRR